VLVTHEDDVAARARQIARFQDGRILEINQSDGGLDHSGVDHSAGAI
jgi:putative ABC transport system ATP-binding protein